MSSRNPVPSPPREPVVNMQSPDEVLGFAIRIAKMGLWTYFPEQDRLLWSAELEEVVGLAHGSFGGTQEAFYGLIDPADVVRVRDAFSRSLETGDESHVVFRYRHGSGEIRWMEMRGMPVANLPETPPRIDGVGIDVTDRVDADQARFRLAAIVESSDDAIISKTLDGMITTWNAGATRLFGYAAGEMIGQPVRNLIPAELQGEEDEILAKLRRGERIEHYETRRCRKDGSAVEVSLTVSPVRDRTGAIVGASKIARDISSVRQGQQERERMLVAERTARAESERLSHMKDEFLATLSHELRTPLSAITGWSTLLRQHQSLPPDQISAAIETIGRNARTLARIVDDLMEMSRIVTGKFRLEPAALDLVQLVRESVAAIEPVAASKDIRVDLESGAEILPAVVDAARIQQVIWNLLTNAVKFTPGGGRVTLRLREEQRFAVIEVEDTGMGIPPEFLPHVFERFRQADGSTNRIHGGLGLGLAIVQNLVVLHGGQVAAESGGEGKGSKFTVRLPWRHARSVVPMSRPDRNDPPGIEQLPPLAGTTVLIVDDEPDNLALLERFLSDAGARVVQAGSASAALATLKAQSIDLILSDLGMPGVDGFEFIRRVRAMNGTKHAVPAIAVTAYAREEDRARSLAAGYQHHVVKPISLAELGAAIGSITRGRPQTTFADLP